MSLHGPNPCNLLEWNCGVLHWHRDLHDSPLATRAWLHGPCTFILRKFFKLMPSRDLHGSLQITRVQLHNSCTFVSPLAFWLSSSRELHEPVALLARPMYFVSVAILSLLTSPSFLLHSYALWLHPKHLKWCRNHGIKILTTETTKTKEIKYYAWDYLPKCHEIIYKYT